MTNKKTVNDYIDQCIDAAIALKVHFPEHSSRGFWMGLKAVYPGRVRITEKMKEEIYSALRARNVEYLIPPVADGLIITINLSTNLLTPDQANRAFQ